MENFVARLPEIVIQILALALAISLHESAHGLAAEKLGDPTARWLGRITLNPIKHVDLVGTIIFPLMLALTGFPVLGWAKPVPYVPRNLRDQKWGPGLVALAGPASNIALGSAALILLLAFKIALPDFKSMLLAIMNYGAQAAPGVLAPLIYFLFWLVMINLILAVFNLIPIPPLDGSHLLAWVLPPRWHQQYAQIGRFGIFILLALFMTGAFGLILKPFFVVVQWIIFS